jgi:hypothetical protein
MDVILLNKLGVNSFAGEDLTPIHLGERAAFVAVLDGSER